MPGRVDKVELVVDPVLGHVPERDTLGFDGDPALTLEIHRVEYLFLHLALLQTAAELNETVGQGALPMVNVGDDRKIADVRHSARRVLPAPQEAGRINGL